MKSFSTLAVVRWLVRDTFQQARGNGVLWLMLAFVVAGVALCLGVRVVDVPNEAGRLEFAFETVAFSRAEGTLAAVRSLEGFLVGWIADGLGLILALMFTAGLLPSMLESSAAPVLLAKPIPRWSLLLGKCLGAIVFVAVQDTLLLGGAWLALGLRTGIWNIGCLLCLPLLLLHFAVFFSFSAMLATLTRNTAACVFGSILFLLLCWGMNFGRHAFFAAPEFNAAARGLGHSVECAYWLLPKPLDWHLILVGSLQPDYQLSPLIDPRGLAERGIWNPAASLMASCGYAAMLLASAAYDFVTAEY
jgi:hypothetical protein